MMSRVFQLLPDKFATSLAIREENIPGESGVFLLILVADHFQKCVSDSREKNYPASFVSTISRLCESFFDIIISYEQNNVDLQQIKDFLCECQPVYAAVKIFSDWGYLQVNSFARHNRFTADAYNQLKNLFLTKIERNLLMEFIELSESENNQEP
jgi:hypothetical protein